ncbi:MAG: TlpA disulfide reductase family protein [Chloroflexota bacterium]
MRKQTSFFLILGLLLMAGCGQAAEPEISESESVSDAAVGVDTENGAEVEIPSDFSLMTLDGQEVTLSDLRGKYVLVNFWATWCIPCRAEMPYLEEISIEHQDQLVILGINMGENEARVSAFIEEMGFTFPILLDPPNELTREHYVRGLPVSFVVGPDGTLVYRRIGEILPEEFDLWLSENLGGSS